MTDSTRSCLRGAGLLLGFLLAGPVHADLLFFKDGFVIEGRVRRESKVEFDPVAREPIVIPQGFFLLDDGARKIYFSPTQVRIVEKKETAAEERIEHKLVKFILRPRP